MRTLPRPEFHLFQDTVQTLPFFVGIDLQSLQDLYTETEYKESDAGDFFFLQGDPATKVFILQHGKVRLGAIQEDGQQVVMRIIAPPTLFGLIAVTAPDSYPISAEAMEPSRAFSLKREPLIRMIGENTTLAMNALQFMSGQIREFQDRFRELATERVERRLARSLIRLASQAGRKTTEGVLIDLPLSRQDLAEMSGTTLFTASRILSMWEAKGLVLTGRERVIIKSPHGLVSVADDLSRPTKKR